jgi:gamma-glutamyltranspeptidase/glutathione hydrolase
MAGFRQDVLNRYPQATQQFLQGGEVPELGYIIKQPQLADTLQAIADNGRAGFYAGAVAKEMVEAVKEVGGNWSLDDLQQYQVVEREPLVGEYRGMRVVSVPPPSSGGVALITMLNILQGYDLQAMDKVSRTHVVVEAMRRAYRDRAEYLGDSDFVDVPVQKLISRNHAESIAKDIDMEQATPSEFLRPAVSSDSGTHTTHFSIIDTAGNRVAATLSINYPFGSGYVAGNSGVLLNDEMDDFSAKPGTPNVYGLVGAEANAIAPGKRPLSSMSPSFVETENGIAILGTPGGSRIITMVLLGILDLADGQLPAHWVALPRYHHQYLPDVIQYEAGTFSDEEREQLEAMGHQLQKIGYRYGNMQAIWWDKTGNQIHAASDPRGEGQALVQ